MKKIMSFHGYSKGLVLTLKGLVLTSKGLVLGSGVGVALGVTTTVLIPFGLKLTRGSELLPLYKINKIITASTTTTAVTTPTVIKVFLFTFYLYTSIFYNLLILMQGVRPMIPY